MYYISESTHKMLCNRYTGNSRNYEASASVLLHSHTWFCDFYVFFIT
ncbi:hypothetical protein QSI_3830 [Clostridioides difficile P28]|nr:hypothetical protein QSI_3830 [Clostridioides difficile P28]